MITVRLPSTLRVGSGDTLTFEQPLANVAAGGIQELRSDADPPARSLYRAGDQRIDPELAGDLIERLVRPLVPHDRAARRQGCP